MCFGPTPYLLQVHGLMAWCTQWLFHVFIILLAEELIHAGFCPPLLFPIQNLHAQKHFLWAIMYFILIQFIFHFHLFFLFWFFLWIMLFIFWVREMLLTLCYFFALISEIPGIRIYFSSWWFPFEYYDSQSETKLLTAAALILQLQNNLLCGSTLNALHHIYRV